MASSRWLSKIRPLRRRNRHVLFGAVFVGVFGADTFFPFGHLRTVGHGRGPGHLEHSFILDRELKLQELAPVVGMNRVLLDLEILFRVPWQSFFRAFVI